MFTEEGQIIEMSKQASNFDEIQARAATAGTKSAVKVQGVYPGTGQRRRAIEGDIILEATSKRILKTCKHGQVRSVTLLRRSRTFALLKAECYSLFTVKYIW